MCPQSCSAGTKPSLAEIVNAITFKHQLPAGIAQINPVQNTWYTVLNTTKNVRIYGIFCQVGIADETLEIRLTTGTEIIVGSVNAVFNTSYQAYLILEAAAPLVSLLSITAAYNMAQGVYSFIEDSSVKIEIRKTTANNTGTLYCRSTYAKL